MKVNKKRYQRPTVWIDNMQVDSLLQQSGTSTFPFNPGDGTEEVLSKKNQWEFLWEDENEEFCE